MGDDVGGDILCQVGHPPLFLENSAEIAFQKERQNFRNDAACDVNPAKRREMQTVVACRAA